MHCLELRSRYDSRERKSESGYLEEFQGPYAILAFAHKLCGLEEFRQRVLAHAKVAVGRAPRV